MEVGNEVGRAAKGVFAMSKTQPATEEQSKVSADVFPNGFPEWYHFTRCLTKQQRDVLFDSLTHPQREKITQTLHKGGWMDVVMRDRLNDFVDFVQREYGFNLIDIRCKVLKGKSVYLPKVVWDYISFELDEYMTQHRHFLVGGIRGVIQKKNNDVVLLVRADSHTEE
jgi:hypothetical protein